MGIAMGIGVGLWLSRPKKNQVFKIQPQNRQGYDLEIKEENAMSLHCIPINKAMPPQRFMKYRPSITVDQRGRMGRVRKITRYLGREGTAYTQRMEGGKIQNLSIADTLRIMWGNEAYKDVWENVPELIDLVEESKIGVTVDLEDDPLTPEGLPVISEENIKTEEDRQASQTFWKGMNAALRQQTIYYLAWLGAGVGVGFGICLALGWIPIYQPPPPSAG